MSVTAIEQFDLSAILQPMQSPEEAEQDALVFAPSLTIVKGTSIGIKTADKLGYAMLPGASDGTQLFVGFSMFSFKTDAAGLVYPLSGTLVAVPSMRNTPWRTAAIWKKGIFNPQDVITRAAPAGEVDTFTPGGTITTGDVNTLTVTWPNNTTTTVTFTVGATTTATAVANGLRAAWNANPDLVGLATPSGTTTLILTAVNLGNALSIASTVPGGVGTLTKATTTAASGRSLADILVGRPGAYQLHNGFWHV